MPSDLSLTLAGIPLANPVMVASGTFGYGRDYAPLVDLDQIGAVMVKGVSTEPWPGNPPPRIWETPSGMLNAIGLQNPGVDAFVRRDLPFLSRRRCKVIVNVIGKQAEEYVEVARRLDGEPGVHALELNISCPNIKEGGIAFGADPRVAADLVAAVRKVTEKPLIPKLSPNVTDIKVMARAVADAGADAISLINTVLAMAIDVKRRRPVLANTFGGLSGPAIRPIAVRMVWEAFESVSVPIIGMGGIMNGRDALEFILAGASAVAVGTATFARPSAALEIVKELANAARDEPLAGLVGAAHPKERPN